VEGNAWKESRVKVKLDSHVPGLLFAAGGPRLLNDATKLQLHWKSNGKIKRGMEE
jgi:hypothetical protein